MTSTLNVFFSNKFPQITQFEILDKELNILLIQLRLNLPLLTVMIHFYAITKVTQVHFERAMPATFSDSLTFVYIQFWSTNARVLSHLVYSQKLY